MYYIEHGDVWFDEAKDPTHQIRPRNDRCVAPAPAQHIADGSTMLALVYSSDGMPLKYGAAGPVRKWMDEHAPAYRESGLGVDLLLAEFPADQRGCDLLNRIRANATMIETMIRKGELPGRVEDLATERADALAQARAAAEDDWAPAPSPFN